MCRMKRLHESERLFMGKASNLYHSALVKMGEVAVTVKREAKESKYPNKPPYVTLEIDGKEYFYSCENDECAAFFEGTEGKTITLIAEGSREEARIDFIDESDAPARPAAPPKRAAAPPARQQPASRPTQRPVPQNAPTGQIARPLGATVGMALNNAVQVCIALKQPFDTKTITQVASDILRAAHWLESGNLLPKSGGPVVSPAEMPPDMNAEPETDLPPF